MKKKQHSFTLSIPQPCGAPLQDMKPVEGGFYCSQCQKTVIDYRTITDRVLYEKMTALNGQHHCGIFRADQIGRSITEPLQPKRSFVSVAALLSGLLLGTQPSQAQGEAHYSKTEQISASSTDSLNVPKEAQKEKTKDICIQGKVTAAMGGLPISPVVVSLLQSDSTLIAYATTDAEGGYAIEAIVPDSMHTFHLFVLAERYEQRSIDISLHDQALIVDIQLQHKWIVQQTEYEVRGGIAMEYFMGNIMYVNTALMGPCVITLPANRPASYSEPIDLGAIEQVGDGTILQTSQLNNAMPKPLPTSPTSEEEKPYAVPSNSNTRKRNSNDDDDTTPTA